jgi:uncharacterized SAM-binding protein YcdF (DUF218 family)
VKRLLAILTIVVAIVFVIRAATFLVINRPQLSDAIVVLAGDSGDQRYWRGIELLHSGYAHQMLVDARADQIIWGHTPADYAAAFVKATASDPPGQIQVCSIRADSTVGEMADVARCLQTLHPHSVLIVTSDYHTRRALSIARHVMPQYRWSAAAAWNSTEFGTHWWQRRTWAKTTVLEWQRLLWWQLADRWHVHKSNSQ